MINLNETFSYFLIRRCLYFVGKLTTINYIFFIPKNISDDHNDYNWWANGSIRAFSHNIILYIYVIVVLIITLLWVFFSNTHHLQDTVIENFWAVIIASQVFFSVKKNIFMYTGMPWNHIESIELKFKSYFQLDVYVYYGNTHVYIMVTCRFAFHRNPYTLYLNPIEFFLVKMIRFFFTAFTSLYAHEIITSNHTRSNTI